MPLPDAAVEERFLHRVGGLQQPQRVGDGDPALAHPPGHLLVGQPELLNQLPVGRRLLQRVQVLPLQVLHQGQFQHLLGGQVLNDDRHRRQAGQFRRPPAPLPCHQLVTVPLPDDDEGLKDAVVLDGEGQFHQFVVPDGHTGLVGIGADVLHRHLQDARRLLASGDQRLQSSAQAEFTRHAPPPLTAPVRRR
jgi:hypothetical protein